MRERNYVVIWPDRGARAAKCLRFTLLLEPVGKNDLQTAQDKMNYEDNNQEQLSPELLELFSAARFRRVLHSFLCPDQFSPGMQPSNSAHSCNQKKLLSRPLHRTLCTRILTCLGNHGVVHARIDTRPQTQFAQTHAHVRPEF